MFAVNSTGVPSCTFRHRLLRLPPLLLPQSELYLMLTPSPELSCNQNMSCNIGQSEGLVTHERAGTPTYLKLYPGGDGAVLFLE